MGTLSHGGTRDIEGRSQTKWLLDTVGFLEQVVILKQAFSPLLLTPNKHHLDW